MPSCWLSLPILFVLSEIYIVRQRNTQIYRDPALDFSVLAVEQKWQWRLSSTTSATVVLPRLAQVKSSQVLSPFFFSPTTRHWGFVFASG
ncbi:hypothetical protein BS47DRAFT_5281 [Hydnum rufescens UP504]|uniref:Secreted protein n=1 Tax=Hydnum rufescens UP504 TaxID=1448309 RepID=A0A9P6E0T8_9AGAM|nr:hypothetical protein BS47DRAFT_5281 [Hydnum rufescens UP504]